MNQPIYASGDVVVTEPRRRRHRVLTALLGLLLLAVCIIIAVVLLIRDTSSKSAMKDVTVGTCRSTAGRPEAGGTILNHSSQTSSYVVRLKFTDRQGNTLSEGIAPVKSVDANQTAKWHLTGDRKASGEVLCKITGVSRTHLPGQ